MDTSALNGSIKLSDLKKVDSSAFFNALKKAKKSIKFEAFVTLHSEEEYARCKCTYLLKDDSAGFAVEKDGNIISVFSDGTHKDASRYLLAKAVKVGGTKLDCFASSKLQLLYSLRGFIPVSKVKFNDEFAPPSWNYERDGRPDIYFWIYNMNNPSPLEDTVYKIDSNKIKEFVNYEDAEEYRNTLVLKQF